VIAVIPSSFNWAKGYESGVNVCPLRKAFEYLRGGRERKSRDGERAPSDGIGPADVSTRGPRRDRSQHSLWCNRAGNHCADRRAQRQSRLAGLV